MLSFEYYQKQGPTRRGRGGPGGGSGGSSKSAAAATGTSSSDASLPPRAYCSPVLSSAAPSPLHSASAPPPSVLPPNQLRLPESSASGASAAAIEGAGSPLAGPASPPSVPGGGGGAANNSVVLRRYVIGVERNGTVVTVREERDTQTRLFNTYIDLHDVTRPGKEIRSERIRRDHPRRMEILCGSASHDRTVIAYTQRTLARTHASGGGGGGGGDDFVAPSASANINNTTGSSNSCGSNVTVTSPPLMPRGVPHQRAVCDRCGDIHAQGRRDGHDEFNCNDLDATVGVDVEAMYGASYEYQAVLVAEGAGVGATAPGLFNPSSFVHFNEKEAWGRKEKQFLSKVQFLHFVDQKTGATVTSGARPHFLHIVDKERIDLYACSTSGNTLDYLYNIVEHHFWSQYMPSSNSLFILQLNQKHQHRNGPRGGGGGGSSVGAPSGSQSGAAFPNGGCPVSPVTPEAADRDFPMPQPAPAVPPTLPQTGGGGGGSGGSISGAVAPSAPPTQIIVGSSVLAGTSSSSSASTTSAQTSAAGGGGQNGAAAAAAATGGGTTATTAATAAEAAAGAGGATRGGGGGGPGASYQHGGPIVTADFSLKKWEFTAKEVSQGGVKTRKLERPLVREVVKSISMKVSSQVFTRRPVYIPTPFCATHAIPDRYLCLQIFSKTERLGNTGTRDPGDASSNGASPPSRDMKYSAQDLKYSSFGSPDSCAPPGERQAVLVLTQRQPSTSLHGDHKTKMTIFCLMTKYVLNLHITSPPSLQPLPSWLPIFVGALKKKILVVYFPRHFLYLIDLQHMSRPSRVLVGTRSPDTVDPNNLTHANLEQHLIDLQERSARRERERAGVVGGGGGGGGGGSVTPAPQHPAGRRGITESPVRASPPGAASPPARQVATAGGGGGGESWAPAYSPEPQIPPTATATEVAEVSPPGERKTLPIAIAGGGGVDSGATGILFDGSASDLVLSTSLDMLPPLSCKQPQAGQAAAAAPTATSATLVRTPDETATGLASCCTASPCSSPSTPLPSGRVCLRAPPLGGGGGGGGGAGLPPRGHTVNGSSSPPPRRLHQQPGKNGSSSDLVIPGVSPTLSAEDGYTSHRVLREGTPAEPSLSASPQQVLSSPEAKGGVGGGRADDVDSDAGCSTGTLPAAAGTDSKHSSSAGGCGAGGGGGPSSAACRRPPLSACLRAGQLGALSTAGVAARRPAAATPVAGLSASCLCRRCEEEVGSFADAVHVDATANWKHASAGHKSAAMYILSVVTTQGTFCVNMANLSFFTYGLSEPVLKEYCVSQMTEANSAEAMHLLIGHLPAASINPLDVVKEHCVRHAYKVTPRIFKEYLVGVAYHKVRVDVRAIERRARGGAAASSARDSRGNAAPFPPPVDPSDLAEYLDFLPKSALCLQGRAAGSTVSPFHFYSASASGALNKQHHDNKNRVDVYAEGLSGTISNMLVASGNDRALALPNTFAYRFPSTRFILNEEVRCSAPEGDAVYADAELCDDEVCDDRLRHNAHSSPHTPVAPETSLASLLLAASAEFTAYHSSQQPGGGGGGGGGGGAGAGGLGLSAVPQPPQHPSHFAAHPLPMTSPSTDKEKKPNSLFASLRKFVGTAVSSVRGGQGNAPATTTMTAHWGRENSPLSSASGTAGSPLACPASPTSHMPGSIYQVSDLLQYEEALEVAFVEGCLEQISVRDDGGEEFSAADEEELLERKRWYLREMYKKTVVKLVEGLVKGIRDALLKAALDLGDSSPGGEEGAGGAGGAAGGGAPSRRRLCSVTSPEYHKKLYNILLALSVALEELSFPRPRILNYELSSLGLKVLSKRGFYQSIARGAIHMNFDIFLLARTEWNNRQHNDDDDDDDDPLEQSDAASAAAASPAASPTDSATAASAAAPAAAQPSQRARDRRERRRRLRKKKDDVGSSLKDILVFLREDERHQALALLRAHSHVEHKHYLLQYHQSVVEAYESVRRKRDEELRRQREAYQQQLLLREQRRGSSAMPDASPPRGSVSMATMRNHPMQGGSGGGGGGSRASSVPPDASPAKLADSVGPISSAMEQPTNFGPLEVLRRTYALTPPLFTSFHPPFFSHTPHTHAHARTHTLLTHRWEDSALPSHVYLHEQAPSFFVQHMAPMVMYQSDENMEEESLTSTNVVSSQFSAGSSGVKRASVYA